MSDNLQDIPRDNAEERERLGRDPEHTRNILLGAVKEYYEGASSEVSEAVPTGGERIPRPTDNAECGGPCDACGGDCMRTGPHEDCVCVEHVVCSNLGVSDHTADMRPCARCEAIVCSAHRYIVSGIPGHGLCEDCTKDPSIIERHRAVEEVSTPDVPLSDVLRDEVDQAESEVSRAGTHGDWVACGKLVRKDRVAFWVHNVTCKNCLKTVHATPKSEEGKP